MKKWKAIIIFAILALLPSCKGGTVENVTLKGLLYYSNNRFTFVPCDEKDAIVSITDEFADSLAVAFHQAIPYYYNGESVYAVLNGTLRKPKRKWLSNEFVYYTFEVKSIVNITKRSDAPCDCLYSEFIGKNNPNWEFEISEIEEFISFRDDETKQSYYFDYAEPDEKDGWLVYEAENVPAGNKIRLAIFSEIIVGEQSNTKNFPIEVILNNKTFIGYARRCY